MFILTLAFFGPAHAEVEKRVALVVGVGNYVNAQMLPNPSNDARLIAATLSTLNFQVQTVIDPDNNALVSALQEFRGRLDGAAVGLFYFAGLGMMVDGQNYLFPTNAKLADEKGLLSGALDVNRVLELMNDLGCISLLFLDAGREGRLTSPISLDRRAHSAAAIGALIAFSTAPGSSADDGDTKNSPFAAALALHMVTPGLDVREMMRRVRIDVQQGTRGKQIPTVIDTLVSNFAFVAKAAEP
jgi:uncharacterized caspase-like protein